MTAEQMKEVHLIQSDILQIRFQILAEQMSSIISCCVRHAERQERVVHYSKIKGMI